METTRPYDDFEEFAGLQTVLELDRIRWEEVPPWIKDPSLLDPEVAFKGGFVEPLAYEYHPALFSPVKDWEKETLKLETGASVVEFAPDGAFTPIEPPPGIYCVVNGTFKLVVTHAGRRRVVSACGRGCLLGLPRLLRMYHARIGVDAPWPRDTQVEAVALGGTPPELRFIPLESAFHLMKTRRDFRRFVANNVAVRFVHRRRIMEVIRRNYVLRSLPPEGLEYVLQFGALRRFDVLSESDSEALSQNVRYLAAGRRANRGALLLAGQASTHFPRSEPEKDHLPADAPGPFVGAGLPGQLVGYENIIIDTEPTRRTDVYVTQGTELLEFCWYVMKVVENGSLLAFSRGFQVMAGETEAEPIAPVVSFQAAHPGLDVVTLAYGAAASLAHDAGGSVVVIDLQGTESFMRAIEAPEPIKVIETVEPADRNPVSELLARWNTTLMPVPIDQRTGGVPQLVVRWPKAGEGARLTVEDILKTIELERMEKSTRRIVVVHDPAPGDDPAFAHDLAERLNLQSEAVFYVGDDSDARYHLSEEEPDALTWVFRMNRAYVEREREHTAKLEGDTVDRHYATRRVVRIPEARNDVLNMRREEIRAEVDGIDPKNVDPSRMARAFQPEVIKRSPLARAFHRLARVVERRTVGVALSGGGAWGFCHIPLLMKLEAEGIPVDFVTGTSFGSVIGAIYTAGGTAALKAFIEENCMKPGEWQAARLTGSIRGVLDSELTTTILGLTPIDSIFLERFINREVQRHGTGGPPLLMTTEIPFYPVGTDLDGLHEFFDVRKSLGWGVRMSGAMPPIYPPVEVSVTGKGKPPPPPPTDPRYEFTFRANPPRARDEHHVVDGAFIANVPSRVARSVGADFVIAANVIPPSPEAPPRMGGILGMFQTMFETFTPTGLLRRADDLNRGTFLQTWKGGDDQGRIWAEYRVTLQPQGFQFYEMWRGQDICEQMGHQIDVYGIRDLRERWEALSPARRGG